MRLNFFPLISVVEPHESIRVSWMPYLVLVSVIWPSAIVFILTSPLGVVVGVSLSMIRDVALWYVVGACWQYLWPAFCWYRSVSCTRYIAACPPGILVSRAPISRSSMYAMSFLYSSRRAVLLSFPTHIFIFSDYNRRYSRKRKSFRLPFPSFNYCREPCSRCGVMQMSVIGYNRKTALG